MKWKKLGHIFDCSNLPSWAENSALTPTPFLLNSETLRVFASFRDKEGIGRIGYVDLSANNPKKILKVSTKPVLDRGRDGMFDDNGMILGDVFKSPSGEIRMYYVGFQLIKRAKFLAFSGLAMSEDGTNFERIAESPIFDRSNDANYIQAIHSVMFDDGIWKIWFAKGNDWQKINDNLFPKYNIWYAESKDGIKINSEHTLCIDVQGEEYRIGKPSVYKKNGEFIMFYTKGSTSGKDYFPGVAFSSDGKKWERRDEDLGMELGASQSFDSEHLCYPKLIDIENKTYALYNGNNMGLDGFGLAELMK